MDDSTPGRNSSTTHSILVLANPAEPQLAMLAALPEKTSLAVGDSPAAFENAAAGADVIFNCSAGRDLLRAVFAMAPHVRWVHSRAAGLDNLLFPELVESPVPLTNGTGVFSASLGEFALAAILYFAKDFRRMIRNQMAGRWEQFDVHEISGQTVGIVGYGDIGRAVATRVRSMGMRVLAVKRHGPPIYNVDPLVDKIYSPEQRCEMIALCDYVVVAAPLTPETRSMIGEAEFAAMRPDSVIINVGRGPVIDEPAMLKALTGGRIKGAGLDVFTHEPLPEGHPFYKMENVLLSPHCADHTMDWLEQAMQFFLENFERYRKGEPLRNIVDKKLGY
jgi:phosphoglycerate dehydrogenase-like enzyme